jgi:hypothetical protein
MSFSSRCVHISLQPLTVFINIRMVRDVHGEKELLALCIKSMVTGKIKYVKEGIVMRKTIQA